MIIPECIMRLIVVGTSHKSIT